MKLPVKCLLVFLLCMSGIVSVLAADDAVWNKNISSGTTALDRGRYAEAEKYLSAALLEAKKFPSNDQRVWKSVYLMQMLSTMLGNFGVALAMRGQYAEAESYCKHSLAIAEKSLGKTQIAQCLDRLAGVYKAQGKYKEAEPLYQRSVQISKTVTGPTQTDLLETIAPHNLDVVPHLDNLASNCKAKGDYKQAESLYQQSLAIVDKAYPANDPELVKNIDNLADVYKTEGKYKEAEALYKRSLAILEKTIGFNQSELAAARKNLAAVYRAEGKSSEADALYRSR